MCLGFTCSKKLGLVYVGFFKKNYFYHSFFSTQRPNGTLKQNLISVSVFKFQIISLKMYVVKFFFVKLQLEKAFQKFDSICLAHHFILLRLNSFGLRVDEEGWWFEQSMS